VIAADESSLVEGGEVEDVFQQAVEMHELLPGIDGSAFIRVPDAQVLLNSSCMTKNAGRVTRGRVPPPAKTPKPLLIIEFK